MLRGRHSLKVPKQIHKSLMHPLFGIIFSFPVKMTQGNDVSVYQLCGDFCLRSCDFSCLQENFVALLTCIGFKFFPIGTITQKVLFIYRYYSFAQHISGFHRKPSYLYILLHRSNHQHRAIRLHCTYNCLQLWELILQKSKHLQYKSLSLQQCNSSAGFQNLRIP